MNARMEVSLAERGKNSTCERVCERERERVGKDTAAAPKVCWGENESEGTGCSRLGVA